MTNQTTTPKLVEGQWVRDPNHKKAGQITDVGDASGWVLVNWGGRDLETVTDPTSLTPVCGPAGKVEELYFAGPQCPFDSAYPEYDADRWYCPECGSTWDRNGQSGTRACAECRQGAEYVDDAGRWLCKDCTIAIAADAAYEAYEQDEDTDDEY